jgi:hypothetical protein
MRCTRAGLAGQHRFGQLEDVVAGDVQHRALDLLEVQLAGRVQQASFWISWCAASRLPSTRSAKNCSVRWPSSPADHALALLAPGAGRSTAAARRARSAAARW